LVTRSGLEVDVDVPSAAHRSFALSSMVRQLHTVPGPRDLGHREFRDLVAVLESRWDDPSVDALVALDPSDPWLIMGLVLGMPSAGDSPPVLTYLHVRGGFRGLGLGTLLASLLGITHGVPTLVEFPTWDLIREREGRDHPVGLLHNPHWDLTMVTPRTGSVTA
jgi:hypothetical protein